MASKQAKTPTASPRGRSAAAQLAKLDTPSDERFAGMTAHEAKQIQTNIAQQLWHLVPFGERLRYMLEVRGMSQSELARATTPRGKDGEPLQRDVLDRDTGRPTGRKTLAAVVSQTTICNLMRGHLPGYRTPSGETRLPSSDVLLALSQALRCRAEWLMTGHGDPEREEAPVVTHAEQELVERFRTMPVDLQKALLLSARAMTTTSKLSH